MWCVLNKMAETKMSEESNFYKILQVDSGAETEVIRLAYKYLHQKYHPYNTTTGSREMFGQVTEAWQILSDKERRDEYDASLRVESD
jgi:DnaJ-class molecular chaperone